jgi:hypothetical protein
MPISINHDFTTAAASSNPMGPYPNQVVIDFGRPGFDDFPVSMRDLIHWTAYRLDCDYGNHRTASLLRAIAEQFYPIEEDQADWIIEEIQTEGRELKYEFEDAVPPVVDIRLLQLVEGFAICTDTFGEEPFMFPAIARNASNYLDFSFPPEAFEHYGIRGIRIHCLDLIHWQQSNIELLEMAHQNEDAWLDAWDASCARGNANSKHRNDLRLRSQYGDHMVEEPSDETSKRTALAADPDAILRELAGLI